MVRRSQLARALALASVLLLPASPTMAQGVPGGTTSGVTPGATGGAQGPVTFRCPGVTDVSVGADSTALSGRPATFRSWDVGRRALAATLEANPGWVRALAVAPDGRSMAFG